MYEAHSVWLSSGINIPGVHGHLLISHTYVDTLCWTDEAQVVWIKVPDLTYFSRNITFHWGITSFFIFTWFSGTRNYAVLLLFLLPFELVSFWQTFFRSTFIPHFSGGIRNHLQRSGCFTELELLVFFRDTEFERRNEPDFNCRWCTQVPS